MKKSKPLADSIATDSTSISLTAVSLSLAASKLVLITLGALHILSSEFDPSWRMVSEYANGDFGWVLSIMFMAWAVSSWALAFAMYNQLNTRGGKIGLGFLITAGIGEAMAAIFDINHSLHGVAALIGIGSLPIAALLISYNLSHTKPWMFAKKALLWTAHATWISVVLILGSFALLMVTFRQAGGDMSAEAQVMTELPNGVIALVGWANRLLIIIYVVWALTVAWLASQLKRMKTVPQPK